jgi:hypothetical protein
MTETGVRVPIASHHTLQRRKFYERKQAAFMAYQGFIHYAELIETGQLAAAARWSSKYYRNGAPVPNEKLPLDVHVGLSRRAVTVRTTVEAAFFAAQAVRALAASWKAWRPRATPPSSPPPPSAPVRPTSLSGLPPGIRESTGASLRGSNFQSASAQTPRSLITAIRADVAESQAYMTALQRGEIGLQRPSGANVGGTDFITARTTPNTGVEVIATDVKSSTVGQFPTPATTVPPNWMAEVRAAVAPGRLNLGDPV